MASTLSNGKNSEDKQAVIKNEKVNKKTLDEEKVLRKKIRHLRREDERQVKSLTQDLKDIRESLSHVNNLKKIGGSASQSRKNRNYDEDNDDDDDDCDNSTTTKRRQGGKYEVKTTGKCQLDQVKTSGKRRNGSEGNCAISSEQKTSSPSEQSKTVRFKDGCAQRKGRESSRKQNETTLSLSTIDFK